VPRRPRDAELVEIVPLDDTTDWSTDDDSSARPTAPPTSPGRGRTAVYGTLAVFGVVAAGIWLATTDGDEETAPTTTTTPTTTTVAPEPTPPVASGFGAVNLVIPDVVGLQPYLAENPAPPTGERRHELWRSADGEAWVLLDARPLEPGEGDVWASPAFDGVPRITDGLLVVGSLVDPARSTARTLVDDWVITAQTRNVTDETLAAFLRTGVARRTGPDFDGGALPGMRNITRGQVSAREALTGVVESRTLYWSVATRQLVTVTVGNDQSRGRGSMLPVMLTDLNEGDNRQWGRVADDPDISFVTWDLPDDRVAVATAAIPPESLAALTARARVAEGDEWDSLVYGLRPDYRLGPFSTIVNSSTASGYAWSAGIQRAERREGDEWLWWWQVPGEPATSDTSQRSTSVSAPAPNRLFGGPRLTTVVYPALTYALVTAPSDAVAILRVSETEFSRPPVEQALVQPFPDRGLWATAFAIDQQVPFEIVLRWPDGSETPLSVTRTTPDTFRLPARYSLAEAGAITGESPRQPFELWRRTADADQWFIVRTVPPLGDPELGPGQFDRRTVRGADWDVVIDSVGLDGDAVNAIEESVSAIGGRPVFRTSPFELGYEPVTNGESEVDDLLGRALLQSFYRNVEVDGDFVLLTIGREQLSTAALQPYAIADLERGQLPDRTGSWVGGSLRYSNGVSILQWTGEGLQYTLLSRSGLPALIAMLPS
jgi:hypothetical protein